MTLDWTTRSALRLYPQHWRDEFEREVVGTLLDVAEAEQRPRPPLSELLPLAARGAWMRARASVVFWVGLVIVAAMIWGVGQSFDGFVSERYWPAMLSRAGIGLVLALPLAGACAAWQAGRRRRVVTVRARLRGLAADAAGPAVFVGLGYIAAIAAQVVASGWPLTATVDLLSVLAYFSMTLAALAVGSLLGTLLPGVVATPLTWAALSLWYLLPLVWIREWSNLTGTGLVSEPVTTLFDAVSPYAVLLVSGTAITIAVMSLALIVVKAARGWLWFTVLVALIAIAVPVNARALTGWWPTSTLTSRSADMVCAGEAPRICLWPEQEAEAGSLLRATLTTAYEQTIALGLPVADEVGAGYRLTPDPDWIIATYAQEVMGKYGCNTELYPQPTIAVTFSEERSRAESSALFATYMVFGADLSKVSPVQVGGEADEPSTGVLTLEQLKEYFAVRDLTEARAAIEAWVERGPTCE